MIPGIVAGAAVGVETDPFFANVVSLLHFEGANGSTSMVDQKGKTWTPSGNAQLTTTTPLMGASSLLLDGTGDYITTPSHADLGFGTGDFTVEFFAMQAAAKAISHLDARAGTANSPRLMLYNTNAAPFSDLRLFVSNADRIIAPNGTLLLNTRQHFAICRASGSTRMFVDGVQVGSTYADSTNYTAADWVIGHNTAAGSMRDFNGRIDELRITKGIGRYTSNFTPPTTPFPNA